MTCVGTPGISWPFAMGAKHLNGTSAAHSYSKTGALWYWMTRYSALPHGARQVRCECIIWTGAVCVCVSVCVVPINVPIIILLSIIILTSFAFLSFCIRESNKARKKNIDWCLDSRLQFNVYKQAIIHSVGISQCECAHSFCMFRNNIVNWSRNSSFFLSLQMKLEEKKAVQTYRHKRNCNGSERC